MYIEYDSMVKAPQDDTKNSESPKVKNRDVVSRLGGRIRIYSDSD